MLGVDAKTFTLEGLAIKVTGPYAIRSKQMPVPLGLALLRGVKKLKSLV